MAEVVGLISSIITFVEFGFKIVSIAKDVRDSAQGTTVEARELDLIVADVQHWNGLLKKQQASGQWLSKDEAYILEMVAECEKLVGKLRHLMGKLRIRGGARSQTVESMRVSAQSFLKHAEIKYLRSQLDSMAARIQKHIANVMDEQRNSSILRELAKIRASHSQMDFYYKSKLDLILKTILALTKQTQAQEYQQTQLQQQIVELGDLKENLNKFRKEQKICVQQLKILKSLYFPELRRRWSQIPETEERTNEWIYDPKKTSFLSWLESPEDGDGLFYITGKAGSGKSTLMKFIGEHQHTIQSLKKWAGTTTLYTASYYFWYQGTEMQKSSRGLFQSLLYQILRLTPDLIPQVCEDRDLSYEVWEMEELKEVYQKIAQQTRLDAKFCFFIDGLDEYGGEEKDIIQLFQALTAIQHIKICASSRPGRQYENFLRHDARTIDIAHFTKEDMERYINTNLQASTRWQQLVVETELACQDIIHEISIRAGGVWLWVFLVTKDIVKEADKSEGLATLRRIVDTLPDDLYDYSEVIINRIPKIHHEEMAQIFLINMEALRPLPLYAFALLEREVENTNYAIDAPIRPMSVDEAESEYPALKNRIQNRCSDLLIVHEDPKIDIPMHPFLGYAVDFLHRTVLDFLREYERHLRTHLVKEFDPLVSLSNICLSLLKRFPTFDLCYCNHLDVLFGLTDELLIYAYGIEKRSKRQEETFMVQLLDQIDIVNSYHITTNGRHWTGENYFLGRYCYKDEHCNFLALAVQARLAKYVRVKLTADRRNMIKPGRSLLDYALHPRKETPKNSMQYRSSRVDLNIDVDMVELLLSHGADPNQPVPLRQNVSVWGHFLTSMRSLYREHTSTPIPNYQSLVQSWYKAAHLLIQAGARADCLPEHMGVASEILISVFGQEKAAILIQRMKHRERQEQREKEAQQSTWSCVVM